MSFSIFKHGIYTSNDTLTGDAGIAINANFVTLANLFDTTLTTGGGTLTGPLTLNSTLTVVGETSLDNGLILTDGNGGLSAGNLRALGFLSIGEDDGIGISCDDHDGLTILSGGLNLFVGDSIYTSGGNTLDDGSGNLTAAAFFGNGAGITGLTKAQVGLSNVTNAAQLPLTGGTMSGNIAMGNHAITNVSSLDFDVNGGTVLTVNGGTPLLYLSTTNLNWLLPLTGTWNGNIISGAYGGTGVNNGTKTILLAGNLATVGAYNVTLTATGTTNVTLPTSGTLATVSQIPAIPVPAVTSVTSANGLLLTSGALSFTGNITSGTWNASVISPTYGGTGVNNGSKTLTLGGNLTTSGAFTISLAATAFTTLVLPTSGTLATTTQLANYLPLSGGNITSGTYGSLGLDGPYLDASSDGLTIALGGETYSLDSGTVLDDGRGNITVANTITATAFYLNNDSVAGLIGGYIPDSYGLPIVDFGLNAAQFGGQNTDYCGGIFRLDSRGSYPFFQVLYQATYTGDECVPFSINNPNSEAMPSVMIGWPGDGDNVG